MIMSYAAISEAAFEGVWGCEMKKKGFGTEPLLQSLEKL